MRTSRVVLVLAAATLGWSTLVVPTLVGPIDVVVGVETYPAFDATGSADGSAHWVVADDTGNCCENYLVATPEGRLIDFGGEAVRFSDDGGRTWSQVTTLPPLVFAEGALVVAPNGDVAGVAWDAYTGDRLQSVKYDAESDAWHSSEITVKGVFYDRPWIGLLPGPLDTPLGPAEYATFVRGEGYSVDTVFTSIDGLTYTDYGNRIVDVTLAQPVESWLDVALPVGAGQAHPNAGLVAIGPGQLWSVDNGLPYNDTSCDSGAMVMDQSLSWRCHALPDGLPTVAWHTAGQDGGLHHLRWSPIGTLTLVTSWDGGRSTSETAVVLPDGVEVRSPDDATLVIAPDGRVVVAALAVDVATDHHRTVVSVLQRDPSRGGYVATGGYLVGRGDIRTSTSGVSAGGDGDDGPTIGRFDFATVAVLPDGRIATSFIDSVHDTPTVAVLASG